MPKGPFGLPRPLSQYRIIIDPHTADVDVLKVGPLGGPRPFAKDNPPIEDERVAECILSESGQSFGAGVVSRGNTTDITELPPQARQEAMALAEDYCRGTLEAAAIENMEEGEAIPVLTRARESLANATGRQDNISIEMRGTPEEIEAELIDVKDAEE